MDTYTASEIITIFKKNHESLYNLMRSTEHGYKGTELNPYHLEGSVWTHTMMVMKEAEKHYNSAIMLLAALCHDIGKVFTLEDNEKNSRRSFKNHEGVSSFYAAQVLESFHLHKYEKERILEIVAQHGSLYNFFEDGRVPKKHWNKIASRFKPSTFQDLINFYKCDHNGRLSNKPSNYVLEDLETISTLMEKDDGRTFILPSLSLTILIGPPRSGKSTWVKENAKFETIISRDDLVLQYGKGTNYSEKWQSLTKEDQASIDKELLNNYQQALKKGENVIVDMTNMSKKSRRKWLNCSHAKDYFKQAYAFITPKETLMQRMTKDKSIPEYAIDSMLKSFTFPDLEEFNHVTIV